jgi:hypothetical protein
MRAAITARDPHLLREFIWARSDSRAGAVNRWAGPIALILPILLPQPCHRERVLYLCGGIDASSKRPWPWSGRRGARLGEPGGPWICGKKRAPRLYHECLQAAAVIPLISRGRMRKLCGLPL